MAARRCSNSEWEGGSLSKSFMCGRRVGFALHRTCIWPKRSKHPNKSNKCDEIDCPERWLRLLDDLDKSKAGGCRPDLFASKIAFQNTSTWFLRVTINPKIKTGLSQAFPSPWWPIVTPRRFVLQRFSAKHSFPSQNGTPHLYNGFDSPQRVTH